MLPKNIRREEKHNANNMFDMSIQQRNRWIISEVGGGERPDGRDSDREREWDRYDWKSERWYDLGMMKLIEKWSDVLLKIDWWME